MKVYLASPFFTEEERNIKARIKAHLLNANCEVIDPQPEGGSSTASWEETNWDWASRVFNEDIEKIDEADMVVAIDGGLYSDSGTAWEIGYACGQDKEVMVVVPKERLNMTHSLMVAFGSAYFITEERFLQIKDFDEDFILKQARGIHLT